MRGLRSIRATVCPQQFALGIVEIGDVRNLYPSVQWSEEFQIEEVYVAFCRRMADCKVGLLLNAWSWPSKAMRIDGGTAYACLSYSVDIRGI